MRRWLGISACVVGIAGFGCHRPEPPVSMTAQRVQLEPPDLYEHLWTSARQTLREDGYAAAMVNRHEGRFTTRPQSSQHFFEFWRHDVHTVYDWFEASVAPVRRSVEVSIPRPGEGEQATQVGVTVRKERLSSPDRQFNESGALFQFFGYVLPASSGQAIVQPEDDRWVQIGRDPAMEAYLLARILRKAGVAATGEQASRGTVEQEPSGTVEPESLETGDHEK